MKTNNNGRFKILTRKEGKNLFDREVRRSLKISGDEFVRKWMAKEFDSEQPEIMRLAFLIPFGR